MIIEIESNLIPLSTRKADLTRMGRMGEERVGDIFKAHDFEVQQLNPSEPFDLVAHNHTGRFAVEVKMQVSDKTRITLTRTDKRLKRKFLKGQTTYDRFTLWNGPWIGMKPMVVLLKCVEYGEDKSRFFVGYRMGIKAPRYPWIGDLDDFFNGLGGSSVAGQLNKSSENSPPGPTHEVTELGDHLVCCVVCKYCYDPDNPEDVKRHKELHREAVSRNPGAQL